MSDVAARLLDTGERPRTTRGRVLADGAEVQLIAQVEEPRHGVPRTTTMLSVAHGAVQHRVGAATARRAQGVH